MNELLAPRYIFVSYATADLALAKFVTELLECRLAPPVEVFLAKRNIEPGSDPLGTMLKGRLLRASALVALCSRDSRHSPWLWWETSSVWTRSQLVVPLFVDVEAGEFGGPLVLLSQGRRLFEASDLTEALHTIVESLAPGSDHRALQEDELAELRRFEQSYRNRPRTGGATRLGLLKEIRDLILESKDAAREARDHGDEVTPRLINAERRIRTAIKQLGDDQLPNELTNFANQAQNARWTLSNWQAADAAVDRMIIDATDGLGQP